MRRILELTLLATLGVIAATILSGSVICGVMVAIEVLRAWWNYFSIQWSHFCGWQHSLFV